MEQLFHLQADLGRHPLYGTLKDLQHVREFMRHHVFAVWDFMSLLKFLQREITCVSVPWRPSKFPTEMVRLINEIVLGEESDVDQNGNAVSHFDLYLRGMEEVGVSTANVTDFLTDLDLRKVPSAARSFVSYNLELVARGDLVEVAAAFFFGREKLIPEMFQGMVEVLKRENIAAPTFLYYLQRHIEVDGEEHGPMALKCLAGLIGDSAESQNKAYVAGIQALEMRKQLWDQVFCSIQDT